MIVDPNQELLELTRENNKILKSMRRHQRWASVIHALYWLAIIGLSFGSYYLIQPYLESILQTYTTIQDGISNITGR